MAAFWAPRRACVILSSLSRTPGNQPELGRTQLFHELRQIVGDASDEELQGLLDMFHGTAAERAREARAALADKDLPTLRRASHTLRTMGACIGAWDLAGMASKLEHWTATCIENGSPPVASEATAMLDRIERELARVRRVAASIEAASIEAASIEAASIEAASIEAE